MMEYGNVAIMGASATQLSRLDTVQNVATALCHASFIPLQHHRHAAACSWITVETVGLVLPRTSADFCPNFYTSNLT